jgi:predicted XRE-type DNA-binding protein
MNDLFEHSTGNIFADLGFDNPEEEQVKCDIAIQIYLRIKNRKGLSIGKASRLIGVTKEQLTNIMTGKLGGLSKGNLLVLWIMAVIKIKG